MADAVLEFEAYQRAAARTIRPGMSKEELLLMAAIGLCGEAGEAAEHIKKAMFHGKPLDVDKLILELGDALWYLACYCSALDMPLAGVAEENIAKLRERYPVKGGFVTKPRRGGAGADDGHAGAVRPLQERRGVRAHERRRAILPLRQRTRRADRAGRADDGLRVRWRRHVRRAYRRDVEGASDGGAHARDAGRPRGAHAGGDCAVRGVR
jgi:NTP pyrophosphatase (non-canonical NTP hydrolase)